MIFKKKSPNFSLTLSLEKKNENVRDRVKNRIFKKFDYNKKRKQQSKVTFNGIHEAYENCDCCIFEQNEV